ncbi:CMRF35-like molecule 5 isoform X1 [Myxocyprinus asiaticus]|uniref:CMRF35-like molecule 5 isoform X1 n=1 Tax=Myxocyprinus asiaticus TaxID=70543 RepID=UPI002221C08E|nr:CMRF35-like molecule 5 isoform X1 [Myxocyprinus asiaticus]
MKFFCVVWIWICLSGFGISATDGINLHGYTDASVTISCSHRWAESNLKYFCRDPCNDRNILVKSGQSPKGRFRLKDFGNGTFTVTISELQLSDSGVYWCGVERSGKDTYNEVNLKIHKATTPTKRWTPKPVARSKSQASTPASSFSKFTPELDDITISPSLTGPLVFTAVGLTVTLIIFGVVLCVWNWQKKKSHSSSGPAHADAELKRKDTTCTTEAAGDYEEIRDTQQQTKPHTLATIYSTVYTSPGGNQIQDPPLCSTLSDQPESYTNQTPNSSTNAAPSVTYASIKIHTEGCGPNTRIRSEDTVTYDTVYFPKDTF